MNRAITPQPSIRRPGYLQPGNQVVHGRRAGLCKRPESSFVFRSECSWRAFRFRVLFRRRSPGTRPEMPVHFDGSANDRVGRGVVSGPGSFTVLRESSAILSAVLPPPPINRQGSANIYLRVATALHERQDAKEPRTPRNAILTLTNSNTRFNKVRFVPCLFFLAPWRLGGCTTEPAQACSNINRQDAKEPRTPREDSILKTDMKVLKYQSDQGCSLSYGFFFCALGPLASWRLDPCSPSDSLGFRFCSSSTALQSTRKSAGVDPHPANFPDPGPSGTCAPRGSRVSGWLSRSASW